MCEPSNLPLENMVVYTSLPQNLFQVNNTSACEASNGQCYENKCPQGYIMIGYCNQTLELICCKVGE